MKQKEGMQTGNPCTLDADKTVIVCPVDAPRRSLKISS